jgi:hypothetical protein
MQMNGTGMRIAVTALALGVSLLGVKADISRSPQRVSAGTDAVQAHLFIRTTRGTFGCAASLSLQRRSSTRHSGRLAVSDRQPVLLSQALVECGFGDKTAK